MNKKELPAGVVLLAALLLGPGVKIAVGAGAPDQPAAKTDAAAPNPALKIKFILDKDYDTHEVYGMLHHDDPAGLASRAKSMGLDLEFARQIKNSGDFNAVSGTVSAMVDNKYLENWPALSGSTAAYADSWETVIGTFSETVPAITGHAWFYGQYVCVVSAYSPGVSSWYGNKIVRKYGEDPVKQRRITAHEIVLSHIFHIARLYYTKDEIADRQVWKFAEISTVFVLNDGRLAQLWPWFTPPQEYFSGSNYPQLAPLEQKLAALYKTRKNFKDYLDASMAVLKNEAPGEIKQ